MTEIRRKTGARVLQHGQPRPGGDSPRGPAIALGRDRFVRGDRLAAERPRLERAPLQSTVSRPRRDGAIDRDDERMNLENMTPDRRAQYEALSRRVAGNPRAQEALYNLLSIGSLDKPALRGGENLLGILNRMADQPVAPGIDRDAMLQQTLIEIDDASTIGQRNKNSCGATAAQVVLANREPAEYARLVSGLASPGGRAQLANGDTLSRETDFNAADGGRSIPSRLLQPAFMEYANGDLTNYDNTADNSRRLDGTTYQGLFPHDEEHLFHGLFNSEASHVNSTANGGTTSQADLLGQVRTSVEAGRPVAALIDYPGAGGHYVTLTGMRDGRVMYQNPWGSVESMSQEAFQPRLLSAIFPGAPTAATPPVPPPPPAPPPPHPAPQPAPRLAPSPVPRLERSLLRRAWDWLTS